jgi:hypothetical protein
VGVYAENAAEALLRDEAGLRAIARFYSVSAARPASGIEPPTLAAIRSRLRVKYGPEWARSCLVFSSIRLRV